jgi:hypothetical protein
MPVSRRSTSSSLRYSSAGDELSMRARGANRTATRRMSAAAQDAAPAAMRAAADRRRVGWMLAYLREGVVHHDYRDHAGLLPEGPARELLPQFYARYQATQAAALEDLRQAWTRLQSMMLLGRVTCAGWRCVTFDGAANGCFRTKNDC